MELTDKRRVTIAEAMQLTGLSRSTFMRHKDEIGFQQEVQQVTHYQEVLVFDLESLRAWAAERGIKIED